MFETLYKTDDPEQLEKAEYYQLHLETERLNGKWMYFVREKHGWFDTETRKPKDHRYTLDPEEGFDSFEEAQKRYEQHLLHRASEGFVHLFSIDPYEGQRYRRIGLPPTQLKAR